MKKIETIKEVAYILILAIIIATITLLNMKVNNLEKDLTNTKILNEQYKEDIQRTYVYYEQLVSDIENVNKKLQLFADELKTFVRSTSK